MKPRVSLAIHNKLYITFGICNEYSHPPEWGGGVMWAAVAQYTIEIVYK
jgi:hypothetical protein